MTVNLFLMTFFWHESKDNGYKILEPKFYVTWIISF